MKRLIVGDIHGCFIEFKELLDLAGLSDEDEIIALGDIVDRGPDSAQVLDFFRRHAHARSIMGNHERKHIRSWRGEIKPALSQIITRYQLGEAYAQAIEFMQGLPLYLELPEAVLVHGFLEPNVALDAQQVTVITGTLTGERYLKEHYDRPWYELYDGHKPLVVGHRHYLGTRQPLIYRERVYGIDTGCYHGGVLTGLVLPEFHLIAVPSRRDYWSETQRWYRSVTRAPLPTAL